jgi:hypothetical protein
VKKQPDQIDTNTRWLIRVIDRIHNALCPEKTGTWQMRVEQVVEAAEKYRAKNETNDKQNAKKTTYSNIA